MTGSKSGWQSVLVLGWATSLLLVWGIRTDATPPPAATSARQLVTAQVRIATPTGQPISGDLSLTFRIYDAATGGNKLWEEVHDGTSLPKVRSTHGMVAVVLGQREALTPAVFDPVGADDRYLAVVLAGSEVGRVRLTSVGYAVAAVSAGGLWDSSTNTSLDIAALDSRWVLASGTGGGVVRTLNGVAPNAQGNFSVSAASNNVIVTNTTNGITLDSVGGVRTVNGIDPDSGGNFQIQGGSNVSVVQSGSGIVLSATGSLTQATADARYLNASGDTVNGNLFLNSLLAFPNGGLIQGGFSGDQQIQLQSSRLAYVSGGALRFEVQGSGATTLNGNMTIVGNLSVVGAKSFVADHPKDPTKVIVYCSLEGPECAMYVRGSAKLSRGRATITLPEHFSLLAVAKGITAQVTPTSDCNGLYIKRKSPTKLVVRELQGGKSSAGFDYMVYAKRKGTENDPVIRPKTK